MASAGNSPYVYLCQPSYDGRVFDAAAAAFHDPGPVRFVKGMLRTEGGGGCSVQPKQFNLFWLDCISRLERENFTHWAMIHADVAPERGWLPLMLGQMDYLGADALAAVITQKDSTGATSTAIEGTPDEENPKRVRLLRKLTLKEIGDGSFGPSGSIEGMDLLLNTGLLVVSLADRSWLKCTPFNFYCEIDWSAEKPTLHSESEDWYFSRLMNKLGKKLYATTAVKVDHLGNARYPNWRPELYTNEKQPVSEVVSLLDRVPQ